MTIYNWTIRGVSIAGRHTTKIAFDMIERSHGHGDHIGFLCLRHMRKLPPPLCILPDVCIPPFKILA